MQEKVRPRLRFLLDRKEIRRIKSTTNTIVAKELDGAIYDLESANMSLSKRGYKWATIQASHSMFHAARALLNRMGYREQSEPGLISALNQLYEREIVDAMLKDFSEAMILTEELHDGMKGSERSAKRIVENATDFLEQTARILAAPREWFERPAPRPSRAKKKKR